MKKSKLMQGRAAIAKKLAALTRTEQANKAVVPNLRNQVQMLLALKIHTAAELKKARADAVAYAESSEYWETEYKYSVEAYIEKAKRFNDLQLRERSQCLTSQLLFREVQSAKKKAIINLVIGTVGWLGFALVVPLYVWC